MMTDTGIIEDIGAWGLWAGFLMGWDTAISGNQRSRKWTACCSTGYDTGFGFSGIRALFFLLIMGHGNGIDNHLYFFLLFGRIDFTSLYVLWWLPTSLEKTKSLIQFGLELNIAGTLTPLLLSIRPSPFLAVIGSGDDRSDVCVGYLSVAMDPAAF